MAAAAITEKFVGSTSSSGALELPSASALDATSCNPTTANGATTSGNNGHSCYGYEEVVVGMDVVEDHHHHQQKVPIWVGLNCKLVSGISKSTTCHDLISSIVPSSQDPSKYVLVEKWKKMERILDPSVKILKVWKAWGDQIGDVSFVLRSSPTADGYIDKKSSRKVHRKRSSTYHQQKAYHEEDCDQEGHRDAMEQLIKLVITQGEAIQAQLKKLRQQEVQIERYEEKMHKIRSSQLGENYVVDTYLKDDIAKGARRIKRREKSPCKRDAHGNYHHHHHHHHHRQNRREHVELLQLQPEQQAGVQPICESESSKKPSTSSGLPSSSPRTENPDEVEVDDSADLNDESSEAIKEKTELMENIFQLNLKLTQEEERLVKLGLKIRKLSDKQRKAEWEELALQDITQELEHLKQVTNEQSQEIEINERNLTALEQLLDDKHDHIAFLTHEIQLMDEESELLQRKALEMAAMDAAGSSHNNHPLYHHPHSEQSQQVFNSHIDPSLELSSYPAHLHHVSSSLPGIVECEEHQERLNYLEEADTNLLQSTIQSSSRRDPDASLTQFKVQTPSTTLSPSSRYKCQQEQQVPQQQRQQSTHDSCSSSCSNSSSSVCVQLSQKQCTTTGNSNMSSDPQDNDSNSDTGISSLHSSVDENPMYVLDTLV